MRTPDYQAGHPRARFMDYHRRLNRPRRILPAVVGVLALLAFAAFAGALVVMLTGCATYSATRTPDGGVTITGASLFTERGIGRATVEGLGTLEGYNANPSVEAFRALGEGLGKGLKP